MSTFQSTGERAIAILGALRRMTGDRATGSVHVVADSDPVTVPKNATLFPVIGDQVDFTKPFRVAADTVATTLGVDVPLTSWIGGAGMNVVDGTVFVWWPTVLGVTVRPAAIAAFENGTSPTSDVLLKSLTWWNDPVDAANIGADLLRAAIREVPGAVLTWNGSAAYTDKGQLATLRRDKWTLLIAVTDQRANAQRALLGLTILDLCEALLLRRQMVDGGMLSQPGILVTGRTPLAVATGSVYAYQLTFETSVTVTGLETDDDDVLPQDWLRTQFVYPTLESETGTHPGVINVAGPMSEDMT